jgi:hypothetical protein
MSTKLDYVPTPKPTPDAIVFSPSQFSKFIEKPHEWYRTEILGEEGFTGNTSSVIGTIVHYCAEQVALGKEVDKEEIEKYIDSKAPSEEYDPKIVRKCYPEMAETLINNYVLGREYLDVEKQIMGELCPGYYAGGTVDALEGSMEDTLITDYKTYSSSRKPSSIPAYYKYQLLVYAAIAMANGYNPTRMRLVYVNRPIVGEISPKTGKRFKSYASEVTVLTEVLTTEDFDFIESMLDLAVDSLEASKKHPELTHVIFHDPRIRV